jgi:serine/threonine protein phosphatase PrpC
MIVNSHSLQGLRKSNEDQHAYFLNLDGKNEDINNINFVSVFDGHGGKTVSKYLKNVMPKYFAKKVESKIYNNSKSSSKLFNFIFNSVQEKLIEKHPKAVSTALCGMISKHPTQDKKILWIVNVGDSRAVLCNHKGEALQLSKDHKPNCKDEKSRIEQLGGQIRFDGSDWRIRDLSLSRAFGDVDATPYVTHLPQIYKYNLNKKDKFIIFGCDGLWDVMSNKKATDYILNLQNKKFKGNYSEKLAEKAIKEGSTDNVTVVVLFLK